MSDVRMLADTYEPSIEHARVPRSQLALFKRPTVAEVLLRTRVRSHVAHRLFYERHLSFEPTTTRKLHPAEEAELDLLCTLVAAVGVRPLPGVLKTLCKPYAYQLDRLEFDLRDQRWALRPPSLCDDEPNLA
jgi:hypothetical protein